MRSRWSLVLLLALTVTAGCGSDDFDAVGGSLPLDVSQDGDSLRVVIDDLGILRSETVVPELEQLPHQREVLYLGQRDEGGFRATPMLRFQLDSTLIPEGVTLSADNVDRVFLELEILDKDASKGFTRRTAVYLLASDLDSTATDADLGTLLGEQLFIADEGISASEAFRFYDPSQDRDDPELLDRFLQWLDDDADLSLALYDLEASGPEDSTVVVSSNFVGFASNEFQRFGTLLNTNNIAETATPEIRIEYTFDDATEVVAFPATFDLTNIQRDTPGPSDLVLGAHLPSRVWFQFDVDADLLPGDATVNSAVLTLWADSTKTLGSVVKSVNAFEALESQATLPDYSTLDRILRAGTSVDVLRADSLSVDLTDYVQRAVNLVVEPDVGVLLGFEFERLEFDVLSFWGVDAPDPALRPKLRVEFTPPADFWR